MLEHFSNCHNEITMLLSFVASLPLIGTFIKIRLIRKKKGNCEHDEHKRKKDLER